MNRVFEPKLTWNSSRDDIINNFYRPALLDCELYQRLAGYFSSTAFSNTANEIIDLIQNNGRIQLITSPDLSNVDKKLLEQSVLESEKILSAIFLEELKNDPDNIKLKFAKIMAYMLTNLINGKPQLEVKIAVPISGPGIYHLKIGIIKYRNCEKIVFVGSINETGMGWCSNIENLTVFRSWGDDTHNQGIIDNQRDFNDLWNGTNSEVRVFDLPHAVREHMLKIRPESNKEFEDTIREIKEIINTKKPKNVQHRTIPKINLKKHQIEAINKWIENNYQGMLEMATGTGKTFTAFGCINRMQRLHKRTVTIIACPQLHLVEQWKDNMTEWNSDTDKPEKIIVDSQITCNSDNLKWKTEFQKILYNYNILPLGSDLHISNNVVIFVTHDTLSLPDFINLVTKIKDARKFLIVDEVHNITKNIAKKVLLEDFELRLGLSATPVRHLDEEGTKVLNDYFHEIVYTLNLKKAIHELHILCPYKYMPYYVQMIPDEMEEYNRLTGLIAQIEEKKRKGTYQKTPNGYDPYLARADLVANAENKDNVLANILDLEFNKRLHKTLIYCTNNPSPISSPKSPKQLERVQRILSDNRIVSDSITWMDKTKDRRHILDLLSSGHFNCVTAVGCLDEGVDIPSVEVGIFMASSGNPKQFIQRRGRILRKSEETNKTEALIYDILVTPPITKAHTYKLSQRKLIAKELIRHKEFASISSNKNDAIQKVSEIAKMFNIDLNALSYDYINNMTL